MAGGVAGAAAVGAGVWATLLRDSVDQSLTSSSTTTTTLPATTTTTTAVAGAGPVPYGDRALVVLKMAGGNDALNTLLPAAGLYRDARPHISIPEADLVALAGTDFTLHPALAPLVPFWDEASMAAIVGVGMTDQTRSHFKAMDTWWSAVPGAVSQTGWLGRWLDATLDGESDPLRAIALGGGQRALVGMETLATVVRSPQAFSLRTFPGVDNNALVDAFLATASPLAATPELAAAQDAIPATIAAVELLASASGDGGDPDVDQAFGRGPSRGNTATALLDTAAGIIGLGTG